jgi:hypothetical protein
MTQATTIPEKWLHGAKGVVRFTVLDPHGITQEHEMPIAGPCVMCGGAIPQAAGRCDLDAHLASVVSSRDARAAALQAIADAHGAMIVTGPMGLPDRNHPLTKWVDAARGVFGCVIVDQAGTESRHFEPIVSTCIGCGKSRVLADAAAVTAAIARHQAERNAYATAMQAHAAAMNLPVK